MRRFPWNRVPDEAIELFTTERQKQIFPFLKSGEDRDDIANRLGISNSAAKQISARMVGILRKAGVVINDVDILPEAAKKEKGSEVIPDEKVTGKNAEEVRRRLQKQMSVFVVTWAQNATPVHAGFLASLQQYCKRRRAKLIVVPGRYKNPTSQWTQANQENEYWVKEVSPYLMDHRIQLNENIIVMGDIKIQPTAVRPLSGFDTITSDKSGIFGHPRLQLKTVATPQNRLPKILTTTGAVTQENYTDTKAGKKGAFHHTLGATVVEVRGEEFHLRQINAIEDGSFIDLDYEYTPTGVKKAAPPLGLVMGDIHTEFMCPMCEEVTFFNRNSIVKSLRPESVVLHDWYDGYSGSHHHKGKVLINFAKHHSGKSNVEGEIRRMFERTKRWIRTTEANFYVVGSNHNEHLTTWLEKCDPKYDPENALFYHQTMVLVLEKTTMGVSRAEIPNPLQLLCEQDEELDRLTFIDRDDSLMIDGIECAQHGDKGANGGRGGLIQFDAIGVKTITGHSHSPGIEGGAYRVGTNSHLRLEYNDGLSSWLNTDCLIYANGKRTLINKIDGKWRA